MLCVDAPAFAEIDVKKSRFLAEIFPVFSQKEARERLKAQKERHKGASHVVHAFVVGSSQVCGCSDDGEPSGTAGRPVLNVLKGAGLTDCIITVTRWFGGTLLGTGGLSRAYADAAKSAIAAAEIRERVQLAHFTAIVPYGLVDSFLRCAKAADAQVNEQRFEAAFSAIKGEIPEKNMAGFAEAANGIGAGDISLAFQ